MSLEEKHSQQQRVNQKKVENNFSTNIVTEEKIETEQKEPNPKISNKTDKEEIDQQEINDFINQLSLLSEKDKKRSVVINTISTPTPTILDIKAEGELEMSKIKKDRVEQKLKKYIEDSIKATYEEIKRIYINIFIFPKKKDKLKKQLKQKIQFLKSLMNRNISFDNETVLKYLNPKEKESLNQFYIDRKFFEERDQEAIKKQIDLNQKLSGIRIPNNHHLHNQVMTIEELIIRSQKIIDKINVN